MTPDHLPYQVITRHVNGIELEVATTGPRDGPLVILLHGFPDLWQGWHFQLPALEAAGYRILIPNQRGYGKSEKPRGISPYDLDQLASDVVQLAESEGHSGFCLAGHDWGGLVAWWVAAKYPDRISRLAILNAPHPGIFKDYVFRHPSQFLRSWYVGFFQLPWLPEVMLARHNYRAMFRAVQASSLPGTFDASDHQYLIHGWSERGALTAMLNYYRAITRRSSKTMKVRITAPTLILFGKQDPTEEPGLAEASLVLCDAGRIKWFDHARHWIQREEYLQVTNDLISFFAEGEPTVP